ncbi:MAG TPA: DUF4402 domain-containing protein, partial [Ferruginibacter sp.]|nr:DUF4402 domain-containing protein [Ferruginibacter sp.]
MKNCRHSVIRCILLAVAIAFTSSAKAQGDPTDSLPGDPGAIYVYTYQNLKFGAFTQGASGGTVVINTDGTRNVTGTVVALNFGVTYFQAQFDVEAAPGSLISITNGPDATLTGSNGGSITLHIGSSDPGSPFNTTVSPPATTRVNIGGTLTVGNISSAPPGAYSGSFSVTFNQE